MAINLLATKLRIPSIPHQRVIRSRLTQKLNEGLEADRQIVLVSAPAGFGKTTCVIEWINDLRMPVAWLSLDAADDDPGKFFPYLIAALQGVDEAIGAEIASVLRSGEVPPADVISAAIINDVLCYGRRFLLVFDDFHVIQDKLILETIEKLATNLPEIMFMTFIGREDPALSLARLRAHNKVTEIRAAELRFNHDEVNVFLNETMNLGLSTLDVISLEDQTEGWIVGLQLAGLSIRDKKDPSGFIAELKGSRRFILNYLAEEVLDRQSEDIRRFLLHTSILDRFTSDLCNAITGLSNSHFILEQLCRANLFLIPLDEEQTWFRYHHLFADLLRDLQNKLDKNATIELHKRAGRWYEQAGLISEAVYHFLAARDYPAAVKLIENNASEMLIQGYSKTVETWLNALPAEFSLHSPRANMAFVLMYLMRGAFSQIPLYMARLQAIFSDAATEMFDPLVKAEWLVIQSYFFSAQGQVNEALLFANQALEMTSEDDGLIKALAYNSLASAYHTIHDFDRSIDACQKAIEYGRKTGNFNTEMIGISILVQIAFQLGRYRLAFKTAQEGIRRVESLGIQSPISAAVYGGLGQAYYKWCEVDKAHGYFNKAIHASNLSGYSDAEIGYGINLSRLYQMAGDLEAANRELQKAIERMNITAPAWVRPEVISQQVRIYLAQGRLDDAEVALSGEGFNPDDILERFASGDELKITFGDGELYNSVLRFLLYKGYIRHGEDKIFRDAITFADRLIEKALRTQYIPIALEALLLRAQVNAAMQNTQASLCDVARVLELAEPEGDISIFLEEGQSIREILAQLLKQDRLHNINKKYVQRILEAQAKIGAAKEPQANHFAHNPLIEFNPSMSDNSDQVLESLSRRELEVLRLINDGYSNQEIAEKLTLSLHTVKKHVSNIFIKLGATSRTQAIAQGRKLNFL